MESNEKQLIEAIEKAVNDYGFRHKEAAKLISTMHRTNQQSFWRFIRACIAVYGANDFPTDLRNQASHNEAADMLTYLKKNGRAIPML